MVSAHALPMRTAPQGLGRARTLSLIVHVSLVGLLFVLPRAWFVEEKPEQVHFTINLGGTPEQSTGGLTQIASRPVQEVAPPPKRPVPVLPASPPKTTSVAAATKPSSKVETSPTPVATPSSVPRPPTTGLKPAPGTAAAETGATASQSNGISFGGEAAGGAQVLDSNFCCPEWAEELKRLILKNWNQDQQEIGRNEVAFEIRRDGTFTTPEIVKSSGSFQLDLASRAAFRGLRLMRLPDKYVGDTLKVRMAFDYNKR